jgi:hypothetical protein
MGTVIERIVALAANLPHMPPRFWGALLVFSVLMVGVFAECSPYAP